MGDLVPAHADRVAGPRRQVMAATVLRGLCRFADIRGIPASWEFLLDYDVIEAFCVAGLAGRAPATRGTYRSVLYRLAEVPHGPPGRRATPFAGAAAPAPYSPGERAELAAARGRPARPSEPLLGAGHGGVRHRGGAAARGAGGAARQRRHRRGRQVLVQVSGPPRGWCRSPRLMPAAPGDWPAARAAGLCSVPARPDRGYKNFVTSFARGLVADPAAPRLTVRRARSSFICDHLAAGTPLAELLAITGICEAESLARYARHAGGAPSKAVLRAWDKPGRRAEWAAAGWTSPGPAGSPVMRRWRSPPN